MKNNWVVYFMDTVHTYISTFLAFRNLKNLMAIFLAFMHTLYTYRK